MDFWWLVPIAYLVGGIPWGLLIVKSVLRVDVRDYGSGTTGATNVLRTAGKGPALLTLAGDAVKAVVMVVLAQLLTGTDAVHASVALAVIAGHIWPVWAGFHGGKGLVTGAAAAGALIPLAGLVGAAVFVTIVALTRYVSVGSVVGVFAVAVAHTVLYLAGVYPGPYLAFAWAGGLLIAAAHHGNVVRLLRGTERRLGERAD
jgi:glycerol-3-phosphate acyltransferase PlsY